jgi:hypothetical protein
MSTPLMPRAAAMTTTNGYASDVYTSEALRLEAVTCCVGFDDLLDHTLGLNHPHLDTMIVVTSHDDRKTQAVCRKHSATCVQTDLFYKNGRNFNKGAAINAGFGYYQYNGWRLHLDADIILPDNFRRLLFNHTHLDPQAIYGADRVDLVGLPELNEHVVSRHRQPQHQHRVLVQTPARGIGSRYVSSLHGYVPIGFFQLWHASCQKDYPYSLGTAAHDDTLFASLWPETKRQLLPSIVVYHLVSRPPTWGENWDGHRQQPRLG